MKCPKCNAVCWRDEHPDGIAASNWACTECEWLEERTVHRSTGDKLKDLPF